MKRKFLKFLPLATAVLLATSCSKDENKDNNEVVNPENQEVVVNDGVKEVPFAITVGKKQKLSKISYEDKDNGGKNAVFIAFDKKDITDGRWMQVTGSGIDASTLTLTSLTTGDGVQRCGLSPYRRFSRRVWRHLVY